MLQLKNICKKYVTGSFTQIALDNVSVSFRDNEFVAILGPSGSGKTTMLNIVGGLDQYDSGDLVIDGVSTKEYKDRDWDTYRNNRIGFVFQSYNLIPHQTILSNVEMALTLSGIKPAERKKRAAEALERVGLGQHINKKPNQLSGGQMQRVAIARALINDPDILLADEPTGALDSKTSVQIMDLLTEIAQDRLVVMVTHNPELAEEYATRIVTLADGVITSDTDPFDPQHAGRPSKSTRRAGMSFLTALSLSFSNLMTKKGRTIMTAFAGSIGIIGIAAILSLANGINHYIDSIEEETLSEYPLQIRSSGMDLTTLIMGGSDSSESNDKSDKDKDAEDTEDQIGVASMVTGMLSSIGSNDLASLKTYLEENEAEVEQYARAIDYKYNVTPQIFDADTSDGVRQVNPDKSFASLGLGSGTSSNSIMSASMSTDVFYQLPAESSLYSNQYDVVAGKWPEKYNEVVLVLSESGRISDFMLYTLGLRDSEELEDMIKQFSEEEEVETPEDMGSYTYDDVVGITFKLVNASDYYQYNKKYKVWKDKSDSKKYMTKLVNAGEDITVVGVVKPNGESSISMLSMGLYYTPELTDHVIDEAAASKIVKSQLKHPKINVFSGKSFDEEANESSDFDMSSMFSIDEDALQNAITFDESALSGAMSFDTGGISLDMSSMSIDFSNIQIGNLDLSDMPDMDLSKYMPAPEEASSEEPEGEGDSADEGEGGSDEATQIAASSIIDQEKVQQAIADLMQGYFAAYQAAVMAGETPPTIEEYMASEEVAAAFGKALQDAVDITGMEEQMQEGIQAALTDYMTNTFQPYLEKKLTASMESAMAQIEAQITQAMTIAMSSLEYQISSMMGQAMGQLSSALENAIGFDAKAFEDAFQFDMDEEELKEVIMSLMMTNTASYDGNLAELGYADKAKPSEIDIFPKDFEAKEGIVGILDTYNQNMEDAGEEDKVITYTDIVGALMSSVTSIINAISALLIAFVAISLIVSSIMIGIITYISVLERKKEIGILRAMGASKRNIGHIFNAETIIVGLLAGLIGVGVTAIGCIPASAIVYARYNVPNVAQLPVLAAVILVLLSVVLTFIGGLIPARSASRKDPVEALRSE